MITYLVEDCAIQCVLNKGSDTVDHIFMIELSSKMVCLHPAAADRWLSLSVQTKKRYSFLHSLPSHTHALTHSDPVTLLMTLGCLKP